MRLSRLSCPVKVRQPSFFGFPAHIDIIPHSSASWRWQVLSNRTRKINASILEQGLRRLRLYSDGKALEIFEHPAALRFAGLVGITIQTGRLSPYFPTAKSLWDVLRPQLISQKEHVPVYTVSEPIQWSYPKLRNGQHAYTAVYPVDTASLSLEVCCDYPGVGKHTLAFDAFKDRDILMHCLGANPPGWPSHLQHLVRLAHFWPHQHAFTWHTPGASTIKAFTEHRAQDLLGALALLCGDGIFAGRVISRLSGHAADVQVVRQAWSRLIQIA